MYYSWFLGWSKESCLFRLVAFLNLVTYVFFRIWVYGWLTGALIWHRDDMSFTLFAVMCLFAATLDILNGLNFYRVLMADYFKVVGNIALKGTSQQRQVSGEQDGDSLLPGGCDGFSSSSKKDN